MGFADSLTIYPHHPSLPAGLLDCILCPYRDVVGKFFFGWPTLVHPCKGVHWRISFLQQYPAWFVCLIWMVLEMKGRWLYSCCFMGFYLQDFFSIAGSILVQFLSSFFSICLVSVHVVHPYSRIDNRCLEEIVFLSYQIGQTFIWSIT